MEKYVLITGASSGLGKATAQALAQKGFKVFAGIRKPQDKKLLEQLHSGIIPVFIDVTNDESVNCAFEKIKSMTDNLFALVNNAGIALAGPVEYIPVDILKKQFEVNVFGAIRTAQKALPLMKNLEDCRIVNISSMASYGIFPFISPYCVSKRALDMFFNSLILESKNPALKVVSIKPGVVSTPIWNKSVEESLKNLESLCAEGKQKYSKEFDFLIQNASKNTTKGLNPQEVAQLVCSVLTIKNPKLSYNIGKDSVFSKFMSYLPLNVCNLLVKTGLKNRINS